jgi:hypothetical protein
MNTPCAWCAPAPRRTSPSAAPPPRGRRRRRRGAPGSSASSATPRPAVAEGAAVAVAGFSHVTMERPNDIGHGSAHVNAPRLQAAANGSRCGTLCRCDWAGWDAWAQRGRFCCRGACSCAAASIIHIALPAAAHPHVGEAGAVRRRGAKALSSVPAERRQRQHDGHLLLPVPAACGALCRRENVRICSAACTREMRRDCSGARRWDAMSLWWGQFCPPSLRQTVALCVLSTRSTSCARVPLVMALKEERAMLACLASLDYIKCAYPAAYLQRGAAA